MDGSIVNDAEVYNLANGVGFSVIQVIESCRRVTGQPIGYKAMPRREGDPAILVGDARLVFETLGWMPRFSELDQIIQTAWDWMCSRRDLTGRT